MKLDFVSAPSRNASFPLDFPFPNRAISARNRGTPRATAFHRCLSQLRIYNTRKGFNPGTRHAALKIQARGCLTDARIEGGRRRERTKALIVRVSKRHLRFNAPSFSSSFTPLLSPSCEQVPLLLLFALKRRPCRIIRTAVELDLIILTVSYEQF